MGFGAAWCRQTVLQHTQCKTDEQADRKQRTSQRDGCLKRGLGEAAERKVEEDKQTDKRDNETLVHRTMWQGKAEGATGK